MILNCSKCGTKFLIPNEALGEAGRKVRCGSCGHVWVQAPPSEEEIEKQKEIVKNQQENLEKAVKERAEGVKPSLPTVVKDAPSVRWLRVAIFLLVMANIFAFIIFNKNVVGQTRFYDIIGHYDTSGVEILHAELLEPKEINGVKVNYIGWAVENKTDELRSLPGRRIRLLDENLNQVTKGTDSKPLTLEPGQVLNFEPNSIPNPDNKGKYLVLEIGNPYELSWR